MHMHAWHDHSRAAVNRAAAAADGAVFMGMRRRDLQLPSHWNSAAAAHSGSMAR